ncbi:hypothetical protein QFZ63_006815 [Streptomyces sp. B3I7]|nr:hypothetical protein [Streptomyces sp. B3I8]MDQ0815101.1 hypothetical protein [Streptomyces sp. B3I7]
MGGAPWGEEEVSEGRSPAGRRAPLLCRAAATRIATVRVG